MYIIVNSVGGDLDRHFKSTLIFIVVIMPDLSGGHQGLPARHITIINIRATTPLNTPQCHSGSPL
jgi:hypothetical protein